MDFKPPAGNSLPSSPLPPAAVNEEGTLAMTYGHATRVFVEDGPAEQLAKVTSIRSRARAWRALDEARRLELVEHALIPANDCIDGFPLAL